MSQPSLLVVSLISAPHPTSSRHGISITKGWNLKIAPIYDVKSRGQNYRIPMAFRCHNSNKKSINRQNGKMLRTRNDQ